jgi:hypothetical protein
VFWRRLAGDYQGMGDEMIDRELVEDVESKMGLAAHNLQAFSKQSWIHGKTAVDVARIQIDLEAAFKSWLTLRVKLQAAGVVSNVGG